MINTNLNHLPEDKQANIRSIVDVIHDEFDQVVGVATKEAKQRSRIVLILLFGSYAKGTYVNDPENGYISDYDILVVLNEPELVDEYKIWHTVEERTALKTGAPVNVIVHTLREVNQELKQGHYFFKDIREQAIQLYQYNHTELLNPGLLVREEARHIAQNHFEHWFGSANGFFKQYQHAMDDKEFKIAAFLLHQAVERYFSCLLLVHTNYRPKSHNIKMLHSLGLQHFEALKDIFPQNSKFNRRCFQLLKKAYIEARYSEHYSITADELAWLAGETEKLKGMTKVLCEARI
ncbi:MAG: HEPN domain-containing protein [Cellvibrionaceae bacterium]